MISHHKFCSMITGPYLTCSCDAFSGTINPDTRPNPYAILGTPMGANDAGATTIRDYLITLLATVWREEECFSGKRPFGNSGWKHDVDKPLILAGFVEGTLDNDGCVETCDYAMVAELMDAAIQALR